MREKILETLTELCGTDEIKKNPDVQLFSTGLLDSFGIIQLFVAIQEELEIEIAPTEVTREEWATPNQIIQYLEERTKE
ncbi:MAG TPA: D-alanine--poly(phosphoribitol) ligase subunit DltC [Desulfitobacterium sp.]|nr:D-alanine--poly(phosphoribitol) ligase subunit DltC [Desulfitobacterium sp.]HVJ50590.1 D-alanine--poly(phosphoribitol) ligase subunit DltC [Desulfitobacterium sp.]